MPKCVVQYDPEFADKNEVHIVSFANAQINCNDDVTVSFHSYENACTEDGLERRRKRNILVADTGRLQYVGYNFGPESSRSAGLCRFHVGLLNRRTKKMRIINAQHYKMQPFLETYDEQKEDAEKSNLEQYDILTKAFGSKRKRKAMEARHRYSIHSDSLIKTTKSAVDEGKELSVDLQQNPTVRDTQSESLPPQNKDATSAKDVYQIHDIIPEDYNALLEIGETFLNATVSDVNVWKKEERFPHYVLDHVLLGAKRKGVSEDTARMLVYFTFLMYMLQLKAKDVRKKDPLPDVSEPFKKTILENYTILQKYENGKVERSFPQRMKDKVTAHLLVLTLFLDDFEINLTNLQKNMKLPMTKLTTICEVLGCHVKSVKKDSGSFHYAVLKLPLFVRNTTNRRKRK